MNTEQAIDRLRSVIRRQHKAISTESSYVYWLRRYMIAIHQYPETLTGEQKLERFLTELVRNRDISASGQNQAFNAILFFYKDVIGQLSRGLIEVYLEQGKVAPGQLDGFQRRPEQP
jgi:hypothetical protein